MTHHTVISVSPLQNKPETAADYSPLLLLSFAAIAAHHLTKKQLRKAKNKMMWQVLKLKLKSMFSFKRKNRDGSSLLAIVLLTSLALGILGVLLWNFGLGLLIFAASMVFSAIYIFIFNPLHKE